MRTGWGILGRVLAKIAGRNENAASIGAIGSRTARRPDCIPDSADLIASRGEAKDALAPRGRFLRILTASIIAFAWAGDALATNIDYACGTTFPGTKLCRNGTGNNCNTGGFTTNATDTVDITGVALGTQITFTFTKNSTISIDETFTTTITGQGGPGGTITVPDPDVETFTSTLNQVQTYVHTVTAADLTEDPFQSNFQIMLQTSPDDRIALDYTISCAAPPAPKLTIKKSVTNGDGSTAFNFTSSPSIGTISPLTPGSGSASTTSSQFTLTGGTAYTLTENVAGLPQGWSFGSASCVLDSGGGTLTTGTTTNGVTLTPQAGQNITCTFNNTRQKSFIKLIKNAVGDTGAINFPISVDQNGGSPPPAITVNVPTNNGTGNVTQEVSPGTFTISEPNPPAGWKLELDLVRWRVRSDGQRDGRPRRNQGMHDHEQEEDRQD